MGQTWDKPLVGRIGEVIGNENLYRESYLKSISTFDPMVGAALQDIDQPAQRPHRRELGEDPHLASALVDVDRVACPGSTRRATTVAWTKNMVDTKHFTSYAAQWFRRPGSNDVSARGSWSTGRCPRSRASSRRH